MRPALARRPPLVVVNYTDATTAYPMVTALPVAFYNIQERVPV